MLVENKKYSLLCELMSMGKIEHALYGWMERRATSIFRKDTYDEKHGNSSYTPIQKEERT